MISQLAHTLQMAVYSRLNTLTRLSTTRGAHGSFIPCSSTHIYSFLLHSTAIGLKVKDGVVLAVEKLVHSKLLVPGANRRIHTVDRHIGLVRNAVQGLPIFSL